MKEPIFMSKAHRLFNFAGTLVFVFVASATCANAAEPAPEFKKNQTGLYHDIFDQNIYYEGTNMLRLDRLYRKLFGKKSPAVDVNIYDEVPDSDFFVNRHARKPLSLAEMEAGPKETDGPDVTSPMTVIKGKFEGLHPGFFIRDSRGDEYLLKFDPPENLELVTSAEVIASRFYHALGYYIPQYTVAIFTPDKLVPGEGATIIDSTGFKKKLTKEKLEEFLLFIPWDADGKFRASASKILKGKNRGGFNFDGRRKNDLKDTVDHKRRREIRALQVFASWLNNYDGRESNTIDLEIVDENGKHKLIHYLIDFNSTLGAGAFGTKPPMFVHEYLLDMGETTKAFLGLGFWEKPWQKRWRETGEQVTSSPAVGYFDNRYFDPAKFKVQLPHYAFKDLTRADGFWAAKQIMAFSDEDIRAAVKAGQYSKPEDAEYIAKILMERRDIVGRYWFNQAAALDRFDVKGDKLVFEDLRIKHHFLDQSVAAYHVEVIVKNGKKGEKKTAIDLRSQELPFQAEWFQRDGVDFLFRTQDLRTGKQSPYVLVQVNGQKQITGITHQD